MVWFLAIQLIDNQRNIKTVLENMSWGFSDMDKDVNPFVAGMHYNAKLDSIIMNSHTGHIQFYNPFSNTLVYHVSINTVAGREGFYSLT